MIIIIYRFFTENEYTCVQIDVNMIQKSHNLLTFLSYRIIIKNSELSFGIRSNKRFCKS